MAPRFIKRPGPRPRRKTARPKTNGRATREDIELPMQSIEAIRQTAQAVIEELRNGDPEKKRA